MRIIRLQLLSSSVIANAAIMSFISGANYVNSYELIMVKLDLIYYCPEALISYVS
jgi:hypothetical protein